jgi:hypothetical protein
MVAAEQPQDDKNLALPENMTPLQIAEHALEWLWETLHDADGKPLVQNAGLAITDVHNVIKGLTALTEQQQESIVGLEALAFKLREQRDEEMRLSETRAKRAAKRVKEEILRDMQLEHGIGDLVSDYILDIMTGAINPEDNEGVVSAYVIDDLREAIQRAADDIGERLDEEYKVDTCSQYETIEELYEAIADGSFGSDDDDDE